MVGGRIQLYNVMDQNLYFVVERWMDRCGNEDIDEGMDGWMDVWMDRWMDGWMDG